MRHSSSSAIIVSMATHLVLRDGTAKNGVVKTLSCPVIPKVNLMKSTQPATRISQPKYSTTAFGVFNYRLRRIQLPPSALLPPYRSAASVASRIPNLALTTAAFLIFRCGCDSGLKTYPLSGRVHFNDGAPLEGGSIIFESVGSQVQARARILEDGTYHLGTEAPGDGAVAGKHRVMVRGQWQGPDKPPKRPVHQKYRSLMSTDLEREVTPEGPNEFDIEVEPSKPRSR